MSNGIGRGMGSHSHNRGLWRSGHSRTKRSRQSISHCPTRESQLGLGYRAANGSPIRNFGERTIEGHTEEGQGLKMKMTVADVSKVLASVARICECNSRVVFNEEGSYIEDKQSGRMTPMHTRNGVYVMEVKVKITPGGQVSTVDQDQNNEQDRTETVFRRLGHDLI